MFAAHPAAPFDESVQALFALEQHAPWCVQLLGKHDVWSPEKYPPEAVQLAGDPERAARAQRQQHGIAIDAQTWADLVAAGAKVGAIVAP